MIRLKQLLFEVKYDHGCVMAYPAPELSSQIVAFGKNIIADDMLYFDPSEPGDYGREKDPHVTIKFGLTESYPPEKMGEFLKGTKPFFIRITGMDVFQNPKFDVIKMNIEGEELHRLRQIFDQLPNVDEHKVYHPHMTIAYVKPGLGARFKNRSTGKFSQTSVSKIVYSDQGKKSSYDLSKMEQVNENIKTLKGTPIKRYKNLVGKLVGSQLYVHKKYAHEVIPAERLKFAAEILKKINPQFHFNSIMWNQKTDEIRFDEAPDFDTAREPHVGKYIKVLPSGMTQDGQSNNIWHHKWLWVKDDYKGFDVDKAKEWSIMWVSKLPQIAKGTDKSFGSQLQQQGLTEYGGDGFSQAILTNNPVEMYGTERYEGTHWEIVKRLFPEEWEQHEEEAFSNVDDAHKDNEDIRTDITFEVANQIAQKHKLVRVVIENGEVIFNTAYSTPPAPKQLAFLKDYAIEHGMELSQSMSGRKQYFDLVEKITLKELLMNEATKEDAALEFLKQKVQSGPFRGQVYLAGGAVRDMVRGEKPKDLDVVVTNHGKEGGMDFARWLAQQMGNYKEGSNPVLFPVFGTAKVELQGQHGGVDLAGMQVEAVFARKEVYTPGSRKPEVFPGTIQDDAFRRDFTVNSLMLDLTTGQTLDITGKGKADIKTGVIRTTSDPDEIFGQDALRMFRAVRFSAKYNWPIDPKTVEGIRKNLDQLVTNNTSRERIRDEMNKMLEITSPRKAFELMKELGLLPYVAKEFQDAVGMGQNIHHDEDVFNHVMTVLEKTRPDLVTRLIALFHDIGKVVTRTVTPTGVHFIGHEKEGGKIAEKIMRSLHYPLDLIQLVKLGVEEHMRLKQGGDDAVKLSDKTLRKFVIKMGDNLEKILDVIHADNIAHASASAMPNQIENVRKRLAALNVKVKQPELPIDGNDIQKKYGIPAGEGIGLIMDTLVELWYKQGHVSEKDADHVIKSLLPDLQQLVVQRRAKRKNIKKDSLPS